MLPPHIQQFYDQVGEHTKTPEWDAFNKDVGAMLDKHEPSTLALVAMIAKFIDIMASKQPDIAPVIIAVMAARARMPLLDFEGGELMRLRRV